MAGAPQASLLSFHSSAAQQRRNDSPHTSLIIIHGFFFSVRSRCTFFKLAKRFWRNRVVPYPIPALALSYDRIARGRFLIGKSTNKRRLVSPLAKRVRGKDDTARARKHIVFSFVLRRAKDDNTAKEGSDGIS